MWYGKGIGMMEIQEWPEAEWAEDKWSSDDWYWDGAGSMMQGGKAMTQRREQTAMRNRFKDLDEEEQEERAVEV